MVEDRRLWKIYRLSQVRSRILGQPAAARPHPGVVGVQAGQLSLDGQDYAAWLVLATAILLWQLPRLRRPLRALRRIRPPWRRLRQSR